MSQKKITVREKQFDLHFHKHVTGGNQMDVETSAPQSFICIGVMQE